MEKVLSDYGATENMNDSIINYIKQKHHHEIVAILLSDDEEQCFTMAINATNLFDYSLEYAHLLFKNPTQAITLLENAFKKASKIIFKEKLEMYPDKMSIKRNVRPCLTALPVCPEIYRTVLPTPADVGQFFCITGTVVRCTVSKMLEYRKLWHCTKCKYEFTTDGTVERDFAASKPTVCGNPDECHSRNFTSMSNGVNPLWCKDYQEVKLQEQVGNLTVGTLPRSMWVVLFNDLVDCCQPGNDVVVSGVLHTRWQPLVQGSRSDIEMVLVAHNVEVKNNSLNSGHVSDDVLSEFKTFWQENQSSPLRGRDFILSCVCPQVFGLYVVKLSVALLLAGGVERIDNNNSKIRGDIHLLLVGDPGTGKSQFLRYVSKVGRRSVLTSGVGTTNAGLTVAAVKDGGKWQLEAGALVLSDGGICCIDEFNSMKEQDKASIHEAMEQQTISVAKAGLVCKLSTRCSVLASSNPKGKYDKYETLSANVAIASPLLSRFDIILVLLDGNNEDWDKLVSSYILEGKDVRIGYDESTAWSMLKMKAYFSVIKNIKPQLTPNCNKILQAYYKKQRSLSDRSAAQTTPRLLQSLIRLAQGHARLMFRSQVLAYDAIVAISVMECSMLGFNLFQDINTLHTTFPSDPESYYNKQAKTILELLGLTHLLPEIAWTSPVVNVNEKDRPIVSIEKDPTLSSQKKYSQISRRSVNVDQTSPALCSKRRASQTESSGSRLDQLPISLARPAEKSAFHTENRDTSFPELDSKKIDSQSEKCHLEESDSERSNDIDEIMNIINSQSSNRKPDCNTTKTVNKHEEGNSITHKTSSFIFSNFKLGNSSRKSDCLDNNFSQGTKRIYDVESAGYSKKNKFDDSEYEECFDTLFGKTVAPDEMNQHQNRSKADGFTSAVSKGTSNNFCRPNTPNRKEKISNNRTNERVSRSEHFTSVFDTNTVLQETEENQNLSNNVSTLSDLNLIFPRNDLEKTTSPNASIFGNLSRFSFGGPNGRARPQSIPKTGFPVCENQKSTSPFVHHTGLENKLNSDFFLC